MSEKKPLPKSTERALDIAVICIAVPAIGLISGLIAVPAIWLWKVALGL